MTKRDKKWDFDAYSWLENYDKRMRDTTLITHLMQSRRLTPYITLPTMQNVFL
jgi:hypothetical protein